MEDIILYDSKTQILSIAGVDYVSLSAKVSQIVLLSRNGDNGAKQEEEERGNNGAHTQPCKWVSTKGACETAHEEKGKSFKDLPSSIDKGWDASQDYQHNMFYGRKSTFPSHKESSITC